MSCDYVKMVLRRIAKTAVIGGMLGAALGGHLAKENWRNKDMHAEIATNEYKPIIPGKNIAPKVNIPPPKAKTINKSPGLINFKIYVQINLLVTNITIATIL